jgi:hypothetical protein
MLVDYTSTDLEDKINDIIDENNGYDPFDVDD